MPLKFAFGVYRTVPSSASMIVTVPFVPFVTATMVAPAFSKLSLASRLRVTLVSSSVLIALGAMSATAATVRLMTCVETLPALSVTRTVKVSAPL
ncbi:hypothetical protein HK414_02880 [Ramlibacter terrae]|uniref:Uncharacterized protein n=1 Tax=Ramlibacter terrae TaxID=2732511 RepID=A0ABX6P3A8_9BURK|nr:hypothetical protein HK414_02880 [Ramlibacter terrae]